jgi:hypothetical protein
MLRGGFRAVTGLISSRNREAFKVATPLATIGIRGTDFMAQLVNPLYMHVNVGEVGLTNGGGTSFFRAGQTAQVQTRTTLARSIPSAPPGTFGGMGNVQLPPSVPGPVPAPPAGAGPQQGAGFTGTVPGSTPVPGGGGSGTPVSPN